MRKTLLATIALVAVALTGPRARAQMPVTDHSNLIQNIRTALQTYQLVQNTAQQIQIMQSQLQYQLQTLKSINPASFGGVLALLNQGTLTYAMLQGDLSTIGYTVNSVNRNFNRLFPKSQSQWQSIRYSDFNGYYDNWSNEITTSSQAAVRAQSSISSIDANNRAIQNILTAANNSSTGQVRQLQLVNQQLALIHTELASLVQNLATVGRVITEWTAASTAEQMMSRERGRRRLDNYTYRGAPSRVLNHLP
jgi:P-type conjugative transfer protein TrbJ